MTIVDSKLEGVGRRVFLITALHILYKRFLKRFHFIIF